MRYPQGRRWVTVAVSEIRREAATLAADAYRHLADAGGRVPSAVRIVDASELRGVDGLAAAVRAVGDLHRGNLDT